MEPKDLVAVNDPKTTLLGPPSSGLIKKFVACNVRFFMLHGRWKQYNSTHLRDI